MIMRAPRDGSQQSRSKTSPHDFEDRVDQDDIGEIKMDGVYADAETPGSALFPTKRPTELLAFSTFAYLGSMNTDLPERNQPGGSGGGRHNVRSFYQKVSLHVFDP